MTSVIATGEGAKVTERSNEHRLCKSDISAQQKVHKLPKSEVCRAPVESLGVSCFLLGSASSTGVWWNMDVNEVIKDGIASGNGYPIANASTINGQSGLVYMCSQDGRVPSYCSMKTARLSFPRTKKKVSGKEVKSLSCIHEVFGIFACGKEAPFSLCFPILVLLRPPCSALLSILCT